MSRNKREERFERWKQLRNRQIEAAVQKGDLTGVYNPSNYSGSDPETTLHLYEMLVLKPLLSDFGAERLATKSLEQIMAGHEELLLRWGAAILTHAQADYGIRSRINLQDGNRQNELIERLVRCGSIEVASYLAGHHFSNGYNGKDLTTLIALAIAQDSTDYVRDAMQTGVQNVSLAQLLLKEFTNKDWMPRRKLQSEVLQFFLRENRDNPDAVDKLVSAYSEMPRQTEDLLDLAKEVLFLGYRPLGKYEGIGLMETMPTLERDYSLRAAQIALKAADLSVTDLKKRALDIAVEAFCHFIEYGSQASEVPELIIEHVLYQPEVEKGGSANIWYWSFKRLMKKKDRDRFDTIYYRILEERFGGDTIFIGGGFDEKLSPHQDSGYTYKSAVADLGLQPGQYTPEQLTGAYRKAALRWHPDLNKTSGAEENMKHINKAHEFLQNNGYM